MCIVGLLYYGMSIVLDLIKRIYGVCWEIFFTLSMCLYSGCGQVSECVQTNKQTNMHCHFPVYRLIRVYSVVIVFVLSVYLFTCHKNWSFMDVAVWMRVGGVLITIIIIRIPMLCPCSCKRSHMHRSPSQY